MSDIEHLCPPVEVAIPDPGVFFRALIAVLSLVLSLVVLRYQLKHFAVSEDWLAGQAPRHDAVIDGISTNPWQYRVLSEYIVEVLAALFRLVGVGTSAALAAAFLVLRLAQNVAIFMLAAALYRRYGLGRAGVVVGLLALAWSIGSAVYAADLSLNTYSDIVLYLLAVLAVVCGRRGAIIPLAALAAANRETGALIPLLALAPYLPGRLRAVPRAAILVAVAGVVAFAVVFAAIHLAYGPRPIYVSAGGTPGLGMLAFNLGRWPTWQQLALTLGVFPFVAGATWRYWPPPMRGLCLVIIPVWIVVHALSSVMAESRLFLVPQALVAIPAAIAGMSAFAARRETR